MRSRARTAPGRLALGLAVAAACAAAGIPAAGAQPADRAVDFDEEAEQYSKFWSGDRFPVDGSYDDKVSQARALWSDGGSKAQVEAIALLRAAIRLSPRRPDAHAWLGTIHQKRGEWAECAAALSHLFELDPDHAPPASSFNDDYALDVELGTCLALSGNYEGAVERFKRVLTAGHSDYLVQQRLAETYMALGRLDEAIETLHNVLRRRPRDAAFHFTLAVAYDRNEQQARAHQHLEQGLSRDRRMSTLSRYNKKFFPAAEEHYYLALGHEAKEQPLWALVHFRAFLEGGAGLWARRARQHIAQLEVKPAGSDLVVRGTATTDRKRAAAVIARADAALQACVAEQPLTLWRVQITTRGAGRGSPKKPRTRKPGRFKHTGLLRPLGRGSVRRSVTPGTRVLLDFQPTPAPAHEVLTKARSCLETAAKAIELPAPTGGSHTYGSVEFRVLAR